MTSNPQVLCLGEILFDCLADQLGKELADVTSWTAYPGGAPANVACALSKLGTPAAFIGCLGEDEQGHELVALLADLGVDLRGIQRHGTAPTRQVYVTRSLTGERHFAGFGNIETDKFADTRLLAEHLPSSLFVDAKYLVMGTLELAYPTSRQAIEKALELAKHYQVEILVDINWRPVFWQDLEGSQPLIKQVLNRVDLIKCSDEEALWLFETDNPQQITEQFPNVKGVLVTAGDKGCDYCLGDHRSHIKPLSVNVVDTTGAGDSFVAGFVHQCCLIGDRLFSDPEKAKQAVSYANAVGTLTTTKPGAIAAQPTAEEVESFLSKHHQG